MSRRIHPKAKRPELDKSFPDRHFLWNLAFFRFSVDFKFSN
jgi:hypothetical protein